MGNLPKVIKFKEGDKLYVKTFLLDASVNINEWGVTAPSIPKNIETAVGRPLVLLNIFDHPPLVDNRQLQPNLEYQERFAIGRYTKVFQDGSAWWGIAEVTDPLAKEAIENNEIPFYVSPRIFRLNPSEPLDAVNEWVFVHGAIVDKPAYGKKATIPAVCEGSSEQCTPALLSAKDELSCPCPKTALLKLVTNSSHVDSSLSQPTPKNLLFMSAQAPQQQINPADFIPKAEYEAKIKSLETEAATYKQANSDLKKSFDEFKASIEEERRKEKITNILSAKIDKPEVLAERVKYFVEAKVAPEVVETAYKDVVIQAPQKKSNEELFASASANQTPEVSQIERFVGYSGKLARRFKA